MSATESNAISKKVDTSNDPKDAPDQLEMFLYKFPEVGREALTALLQLFTRYDRDHNNSLEEDSAMMLFEARGETKRLLELRDLAAKYDFTGDKRLNFLEVATGVFEKDWVELHNLGDLEQYERAMKAIKDAKASQEAAAAKRAAELEAESKLTGVAGMAAFFKRKQEDSGRDAEGLTNEQRIKAEAARRKALREAQEGNALDRIAKQKKEEEEKLAKQAAKDKEERAKRQAEFRARHEKVCKK